MNIVIGRNPAFGIKSILSQPLSKLQGRDYTWGHGGRKPTPLPCTPWMKVRGQVPSCSPQAR